MSLTQHIGYGRYHLEVFLSGELFTSYDRRLALACVSRPFPPPADSAKRKFLAWSAARRSL